MARPHMLKNLVVDEISLVDFGASPGALVVLAKRREQEKEAEMTTFSHDEVIAEHDDTVFRVAKHFASGEASSADFPTLSAADFTASTNERYFFVA